MENLEDRPRPTPHEVYVMLKGIWSDPAKGVEQTQTELRELARKAEWLADTLNGTWKTADVEAQRGRLD